MCIEKVHCDFMLMLHVKYNTFCMQHDSKDYPNSKVEHRLTQNRKLKTKRRYLRHTVIQSSCSSLYRLPIAPVREKRKKEMKQKRSSYKVVDVPSLLRDKMGEGQRGGGGQERKQAFGKMAVKHCSFP